MGLDELTRNCAEAKGLLKEVLWLNGNQPIGYCPLLPKAAVCPYITAKRQKVYETKEESFTVVKYYRCGIQS